MSATDKLFEYVGKEGHVIRQAPLAFLASLVLGVMGGGFIANWHYSERISVLTAEIEDYKERLGIAPRVSAYSKLSNKELKDAVQDLVNRLTEFDQRESQQREQIENEREFNPKWTPDQIRQNQAQESARWIQDYNQEQGEYTRSLAGDVSNAFRELQIRLPAETVKPIATTFSSERMAQGVIGTGSLVGPRPAAAVAQYLDRLAKQLP
jgi:hypothetical protein